MTVYKNWHLSILLMLCVAPSNKDESIQPHRVCQAKKVAARWPKRRRTDAGWLREFVYKLKRGFPFAQFCLHLATLRFCKL